MPFRQSAGDLEPIRERLYDCMWNDVGILRTAPALQRALVTLGELDGALDRTGTGDSDRAYNLTWHDWLNLRSLITVGRAITTAALARDDSCGAHFREDGGARDPSSPPTYIILRQHDNRLEIARKRVRFTRVAPPTPV